MSFEALRKGLDDVVEGGRLYWDSATMPFLHRIAKQSRRGCTIVFMWVASRMREGERQWIGLEVKAGEFFCPM